MDANRTASLNRTEFSLKTEIRQHETPADETAITEITIAKDGRIYVFGLSKEVLAILADLCPDNPAIRERMLRLPEPRWPDVVPESDSRSE